MLLPHESTVAHEQRFIMEEPMISRTRLRQEQQPTENAQTTQQIHDEIQNITLNAEDFNKIQVKIY